VSNYSTGLSTRRAPQSPLLKQPALLKLEPDQRLKLLEQKLGELRKQPDQPNQQPGPQALVLNPKQPPQPKQPSSQQPLQEWRAPLASRRGTV
jgi:hypothetical protein